MRFLHWTRPYFDVAILVKFTAIIDAGLRPSLENNFQIFFEAVAQLFEWNAKRERFPFDETMSDAKLESAVAQAIKSRIIFRDAQRIVVGQQDHRRTQAHFESLLRDRGADYRGSRKKTAEGMEMMLGEPDRLEA